MQVDRRLALLPADACPVPADLNELIKILRSASTTVRGVEKIREALAKKGARVMDLFRTWDANGDGGINRQEFRDAVKLVGVDLPLGQIDACFDSLDRQGTRPRHVHVHVHIHMQTVCSRPPQPPSECLRCISDTVRVPSSRISDTSYVGCRRWQQLAPSLSRHSPRSCAVIARPRRPRRRLA